VARQTQRWYCRSIEKRLGGILNEKRNK